MGVNEKEQNNEPRSDEGGGSDDEGVVETTTEEGDLILDTGSVDGGHGCKAKMPAGKRGRRKCQYDDGTRCRRKESSPASYRAERRGRRRGWGKRKKGEGVRKAKRSDEKQASGLFTSSDGSSSPVRALLNLRSCFLHARSAPRDKRGSGGRCAGGW
jgi:hypothetical protein